VQPRQLQLANTTEHLSSSTVKSQSYNHVFPVEERPHNVIQASSSVHPVFITPWRSATPHSNPARCHLRIPSLTPRFQLACNTFGFYVAVPTSSGGECLDLPTDPLRQISIILADIARSALEQYLDRLGCCVPLRVIGGNCPSQMLN
jgi:hypothetical protein